MGKTFRRNSEDYDNNVYKNERKFRKLKRFEKTYRGQNEIMNYITGESRYISGEVEDGRR